MIRSYGSASAIAPCGSTERSGSSVNHHGTPLIIGRITVSSPTSGPSLPASSTSAGAFRAMMTSSCGPRSAGSDAVATATQRVSPMSVTRRPSASIAPSVPSRATTLTSRPDSASRPAIQPPIAPAPTTAILTCAGCPRSCGGSASRGRDRGTAGWN